ncbi:indigoidine synthase A-like protein [Obba rivulosa]|uniref:Indigoidine synthase A-like protein n=1 Tax=Obba rivulosa TaxID=1052685 RepID=A0A8E2DV14_9APHY|nr:indigoidine synthase A-like protein [Obba rivulosa]
MLRHTTVPRSLCRGRISRRHVSSLADSLKKGAPVDVHPEVQDALASRRPVVALETTIVTHGMPQPVNLETAKSVESIVRRTGAIPATIGIIGGRVKIGLHPHELEYLADVKNNPGVVKLSRRDIGPALALKKDGGTTCSATLIFAALAGIKVFATGGLGGVHRGGETSMDISADLQELTRCPVGLVSAGVKSILDIGRTLEYLETLGVPVLSYADTDDFPAFYSRHSGFKSPWRINDPVSAARILHSQWQLGMPNGALFGVPIPEKYEAVGELLQQSVEQALKEADENGMSKRGKEATPWLLKRVGELTAGKSLASNVALIENTAHIGGQIAVAYSEMETSLPDSGLHRNCYIPATVTSAEAENRQEKPQTSRSQSNVVSPSAKLVVVGSAAVDITAQASPKSGTDVSLGSQSTSPGSVSLSLGGVARNVAEAAHRVLTAHSKDRSLDTLLISPLGNDSFGHLLVDETEQIGMRTDGFVRTEGSRSSVCNMVLDIQGSLIGGVADMDIIHSLDMQTVLATLKTHTPELIALDANLASSALSSLVGYCVQHNTAVLFEPTSVMKSTMILPAVAAAMSSATLTRAPVTYVTPNLLELARMYQEAHAGPLELTSHANWWKVIDNMSLGSQFRMDLEILARREVCDEDSTKGTLSFLVDKGIAQMAVHLLPFFQHLIIKCGNRGVLVVFHIPGDRASSSAWSQERSNVRGRYIVAHGKPGTGVFVLKHFPALRLSKEDTVNVTGAGDSLVGSILATLLQQPRALQSRHAVSPLLSTAQALDLENN